MSTTVPNAVPTNAISNSSVVAVTVKVTLDELTPLSDAVIVVKPAVVPAIASPGVVPLIVAMPVLEDVQATAVVMSAIVPSL